MRKCEIDLIEVYPSFKVQISGGEDQFWMGIQEFVIHNDNLKLMEYDNCPLNSFKFGVNDIKGLEGLEKYLEDFETLKYYYEKYMKD